MAEVKGVRRQLLDDLKNRRNLVRNEEAQNSTLKDEKNNLSLEHKEGIQGIFHKSMELLTSSILNNNFCVCVHVQKSKYQN